MIVTFHLVAYFAIYVWNTYISSHIGVGGSSESTPPDNSTDSPKPNGNNQTNPTNTTETPNEPNKGGETAKPGQGKESTSPEGIDVKHPEKGNTPGKEGKGDFHYSAQGKESDKNIHPCLSQILSDDEDRGTDIIYNVEPEYSCVCTEKKIQFFPPVYIQRYMEIERILKEPHWAKTIKKVIDFGCAQLSFEMKYLKKLHGIEEIVSVDIDSETLENNCCKVIPFPTDYLKKRPTPLIVRVFCGSVAHTHESLTGADAVIAIELIEHLFPPELDCLPFTIFGFIKPKIAVFTTPNADFNVLFTGLSGFRHPDHKFEWSQQQFEDWAYNLVERYPEYQVMFRGVGPGPPGSEKYGCCSQMAVFVKTKECHFISEHEIHVQDGPYELIRETVFPYFKDERTEEEKIREAAEYFITNCKMRSRIHDEVKKEISLNSVMGRIKYYDREKLKEMLIERSWEIKMNSSGEDVVVFPDSEEEEEEEDSLCSEPACSEYPIDNFENVGKGDTNNSPVSEENWDCEVVNMDMTLNGELCNSEVYAQSNTSTDHPCVFDESYHSKDSVNSEVSILDVTNLEKQTSRDKLNFSPSEKCSISEITVPDIELSDRLCSSQVEIVPEKDPNLNFEKSIYETPYNNGLSKSLKSNCDLCDSPSFSDQTVNGCKRALIMKSPSGFAQCESGSRTDDPFCCLSTTPSSCDTSLYATPSCSHRHRNNIPKCLSLQQISTLCSSPVFNTEPDNTPLKEGSLVKKNSDKFSKSVEGFKSLESDLTCSSTSRVVDSGYPDSYSEYNMDMDLTPEQFDDIETENIDDASSRSLSPAPPPPQIPWLVDDVQNGDVANNNRDGEGNNLVADMEEEPLLFEARIDEINNDVLNLAAANNAINFNHDFKSGEPLHEICGDHCLPSLSDPPSQSDVTNDHPCLSEKSPSSDLLKLKSVFTEKNADMLLNDSFEKPCLRNTKSDTSISTNCSWIFSSTESQMDNNSVGVNNHLKKQTPKLKTHNSLTTVLDGCSKFSNCSLVRPVEVYQMTGQESDTPSDLSNSSPNGTEKQNQPGGISDVQIMPSLISFYLQDDRQSLLSVYQSAESLINSNEPLTPVHSETFSFPDWLLNILISDVNEPETESVDSAQSVWDSDSLEERMTLNYDVQVDARGGGDPQRDTWH